MKPGTIIRYCTIALIALQLGACSSVQCCFAIQQGDAKKTRYLVIGVGILSVAKSDASMAVVATKMNAVGLSASSQPGLQLGLGYASSTAIEVSENAKDVRLEINHRLDGSSLINVDSATLNNKTGEQQHGEALP